VDGILSPQCTGRGFARPSGPSTQCLPCPTRPRSSLTSRPRLPATASAAADRLGEPVGRILVGVTQFCSGGFAPPCQRAKRKGPLLHRSGPFSFAKLWSAVACYRCSCDSELCSERRKTRQRQFLPLLSLLLSSPAPRDGEASFAKKSGSKLPHSTASLPPVRLSFWLQG